MAKPKKSKRKPKTEDKAMPEHPLAHTPGNASQAVCPECGERVQRRDLLCRFCGAELDSVGDRGGYKAGILKTIAAKTNWIYSVLVLGVIGVGGYFIYIKAVVPITKVVKEDKTLATYTGASQEKARNLEKKINTAHKTALEEKPKTYREEIIAFARDGQNRNLHLASKIVTKLEDKDVDGLIEYVLAEKDIELVKRLLTIMAISHSNYARDKVSELLLSDNGSIRYASFIAIKKFDKKRLLEVLTKVLASENKEAIELALDLSNKLTLKEFAPEVAKLISSPTPTLQIAAANVLSRLKIPDAAIPQAIEIITTGSIDVSMAMSGALASTPNGLSALMLELKKVDIDASNPNDIMRLMVLARGVMWSQGKEAKHLLADMACSHMPKEDALKLARNLLSAKNSRDRLVQIANIYEKGLVVAPLDNILLLCLVDPTPEVRALAFDVLTLHPNLLTSDILFFIMGDEDFAIAQHAIRYYMHISKTQDKYADCIPQMLKGESKQRKIIASGLLALNGQDTTREFLEDIVLQKIVSSTELRGWAAVCLSKLGTNIDAQTIFNSLNWRRPDVGNALLLVAADKLEHKDANAMVREYLEKKSTIPAVKLALLEARLILGDENTYKSILALVDKKGSVSTMLATRILLGRLSPRDVITVIEYLDRLRGVERPLILSTVLSVGEKAEKYLQYILPAADIPMSKSIIVAMSGFGTKASKISKRMVLSNLKDTSLGAVSKQAFFKMTRVKGKNEWPLRRYASQAGLQKLKDPPVTVRKFFNGLCMNMPESWQPTPTGIVTGGQNSTLKIEMDIESHALGSINPKEEKPLLKLSDFLESNNYAKFAGRTINSQDGYKVFLASRLSNYDMESMGARIFDYTDNSTTLHVFVKLQTSSQFITGRMSFRAEGYMYGQYRELIEKKMLKTLSAESNVRQSVGRGRAGSNTSSKILRAEWLSIQMPDGWAASGALTGKAKDALGAPEVHVTLDSDPKYEGITTPKNKRKYKDLKVWRRLYARELSHRKIVNSWVPKKGVSTSMMGFISFPPGEGASFSVSDRNTNSFYYYYLVLYRTENKDYYATIEFKCNIKDKSKYLRVFGVTFKNLISIKTRGYE